VCYPIRDGVRQFRHFETISAARGHIDLKLVEIDNLGRQAFALSDKQRLDAAEAIKLLGTTKLVDAAKFWCEHHNSSVGQRTVSELVAEYLAEKQKAGLRRHTIADARRRCTMFARDHGRRLVFDIKLADVSGFLDQWRGISRLNYRTALIALFNFAVKRGIRADNPVHAIDRPKLDQKMPEIFTASEVERLLLHTQSRYPRLIPALTIGLFSGLRQNEIDLMDWSQVDMEGKTIRVLPEIAKRRRTRIVDMSENLIEWLKPYHKPAGRLGVPYSVYRRQVEEILKAAKIARWPRNGLRHTFASAHFAMHEDAGRTAKDLGHMSPALLYDHYRNLMSKQDAQKFWSLLPKPASELPVPEKMPQKRTPEATPANAQE
jgi:integrase